MSCGSSAALWSTKYCLPGSQTEVRPGRGACADAEILCRDRGANTKFIPFHTSPESFLSILPRTPAPKRLTWHCCRISAEVLCASVHNRSVHPRSVATITRDPLPDLTQSSYDFHCGLESPLSFIRREWKAVTLFGGGFCLLMLLAVFWVDPAFFYPRLSTDPLYYYLKAKSLVETGNTAAQLAVNSPPFPYAAMPGVLRAPILFLFSEFDTQWRAMQLMNIPIVACVALMSAYILSWTQPTSRHWMTIAFAFVFTTLSPVWMANVFIPLADAPYAAFTLVALLVSIHIMCSPRPLNRMRAWVAVYGIFFVISFFLRFTAPVLLVFAATLARGRLRGHTISRSAKRWLILAPILVTGVLVALNSQAIFGRYLREPIIFIIAGDKAGMFFNLLGLATPDQIVPDFHLGFSVPPVTDILYGEFAHTRSDAIWTAVGIAISAIAIRGIWVSRAQFLPEILYLLAPLVVLALMLPSTSRYLMSYQPFFWVFFYEGSADVVRRYIPSLTSSSRARVVAACAVLVVTGLVGGLRWYRIAGTGAARNYAVTMAQAPQYVTEVSRTFRALRGYIETLPKGKTLLVGGYGETGRWKAIADLSYYVPDSALVAVAAQKEVYLIVECGTLEYCQSFPEWKNRMQERLCNFGEFTYDSVFAVQSNSARAEVFRVTPAI